VSDDHPSTRTFSLEDIYLLLRQDNLKYMVMISNQGQIHYIKRKKILMQKMRE